MIFSLLLIVDAIIIVRYIFVFKLKNPAAFHDDFWFVFATVWIHSFSVLTNGSWYYFGMDQQPFSYYMCTGRNPFELLPTQKSSKVYGVVETASALLNIVLYTKIFLFKRKARRVLPVANNGLTTTTTHNVFELEKHSLATIASNTIVILIYGISAIVVRKMNATKLEDVDSASFQALTFYRSLIAPILLMMLIILSCIMNKSYIRAVAQEFISLRLFAWN